MSLKEENVCRFCFKLANDEFEKVNEITREIIEVLLANVNLDITENSVICRECANTIKKSFYFKSLCMDTEKDIFSFVVDKPKNTFNLKDIYNARHSSRLEGTRNKDFCICRFCFKQLQSKNCISLDDMTSDAIFMEILPISMPEIDFSITQISLICFSCKENLENYLKFMWNCLNMEGRIRGDIPGEIAFSDVYSRSAKGEVLDFKDEDHVMTKTPLEARGYKHKCTECSFTTKYIKQLRTHMLMHNIPLEVRMYKCEFCMYETKTKRCLDMHVLNHRDISEVKMYKCETCTFVTKYKSYLKYHMLIHKDISEVKVFKCTYCTYETRYKRCLDMHVLTHKDASEVEMYKCAICTFETKYKKQLKSHMLVHKDPSEVKMYKCTLCNHETKRKYHLKMHMLTHRDESEVVSYKCPLCPKTTTQKPYLRKHVLRHKEGLSNEMYTYVLNGYKPSKKSNYNRPKKLGNNAKIKVFKCDVCQHEAKSSTSLKNHMVTHTDMSEVEKYKCLVCSYETIHEKYIKNHMKNHKDASEVKMFKCESCPYESRRQVDMKRHTLCHKYLFEGRMYKCETCTYQTKRINNLTRHMQTHKASEVLTYKCTMCAYETNDKQGIKTHMMTHGGASEAEDMFEYEIKREDKLVPANGVSERIYKCVSCSYETKYKRCLTTHMLVHRDASELEMYKCAMCSYETKRKVSLKKHIKVVHTPALKEYVDEYSGPK